MENKDQFAVSEKVHNFVHSRKGRFAGKIVSSSTDSEWVEIEIMEDCVLNYKSIINHADRFKSVGERLTARKSLLKIVE